MLRPGKGSCRHWCGNGETADTGSEGKVSQPSNLHQAWVREAQREVGFPHSMPGGKERPGRDAAITGTEPGREREILRFSSLPSSTASYGRTQAETSPCHRLGSSGGRSEGKHALHGCVLQNDPPGHPVTLPELSRSPPGAVLKHHSYCMRQTAVGKQHPPESNSKCS